MAIPEEQAETAAFLTSLAGQEGVETHISAVFRGADTVWKLKKAVRLGFLDFSLLKSRRHFLDRELVLNAAFVPGLYRDVVPVTRESGGLALDGRGAVVDWVLRMAPVAPDDFLDEMADAGRLDGPLLTALADEVAAMHAAQAVTRVADPVGRMRQVVQGNAAAARDAGLDPAAVAHWEREVGAALNRVSGLLAARGPLVRRAHGDLHLGNVLLWRGRPTPFDALEFDEALATIDPGYDLAFLLMDLEQRVSRAAANRVLSRYVARTGDAGLVGGLPVFLSLRALIRAHVEAARKRDAKSLLHAATGYLRPNDPSVVAVGGLMGTGKSTLAQALAPGLGAAPGALVLRSDEVRKRVFGVAPEERLPKTAYDADGNRRTQAALLDDVQVALAGKHAVIVDGTFSEPALQNGVERAASEAGVPFTGLWLEADLALLERRVAERRRDASDATVDVLRAAAARVQAPAHWTHIDAGDPRSMQEQVQRQVAML